MAFYKQRVFGWDLQDLIEPSFFERSDVQFLANSKPIPVLGTPSTQEAKNDMFQHIKCPTYIVIFGPVETRIVKQIFTEKIEKTWVKGIFSYIFNKSINFHNFSGY